MVLHAGIAETIQEPFMIDKTVPIGDSIGRGWETFKAHPFFLVAAFVVVSVAYAIIERAEALGDEMGFPVELLIRIGYAIAAAVIEIGIINVCLRLIDGADARFEDLVSAAGVLVKFVIASILYGLMVVFGFLLLIIPGFYLAIKFGFFGYFVVDEKLDPFEALTASSKLTDGVKLELFFLFILLLAINVLGLLCLIVGVYVSWPVTRLAVANVYRELRKQAPVVAGGMADS